jgi:signal transduction histidine kinase
MDIADLHTIPIFDGLSDDQLAELLAGGTEMAIEPGVELFREGAHADFWWVLVDGEIELSRRVAREDTVVARMDEPGRWAGGFRAWDEHGTYLATGRGSTSGRVFCVPADVLRDRIAAWFPFGGHLIRGLYSTARSIESTVRQRESLVTLGTLAAGLAHEINNPAAAATRAVDALELANETVLSSLGRLAGQDITAQHFAALDVLRRELRPPAADLDPLDRADNEQALAAWIAAHGAANAWQIAPSLVAAGVDPSWCERVNAALHGQGLEPALEWVASTCSVAALLAEVKESTRRVSELVAAVRSYSQLDRGSLQQIDVTDGLVSTLVMLSHKLGDISVVKNFAPDVPKISAYAGELNQVWTNLIDNAVDAMDGHGVLRVSTRFESGEVVVEIADSGAGMTPETIARAFETFYTTKEVGKGTGLGLDIARRIVVERHGGTITITSQPGATVLRVALPLKPR